MARFLLLVLLTVLPALLLQAQSKPDTTLVLDSITVHTTRWHGIGSAFEIQPMDSLARTIFIHDDLRAWLGSNTPAFVKDYGPGQSAILSVRGGNAGHTAVQWNGFPLQHPMLGTVDLSLLPVSLIDNAHLEHGAYGAGWGSGAVGGVLHLENQIATDAKWRAGLATGSFSDYRAHLSVNGQLKKWYWTSRAFHRQAENDFSFRMPSGEQKTQSHSAFQSSGLLNGATRYGRQSKLSIFSWIQQADREIPPSMRDAKSEATQQDGLLRHVMDYKYWNNQTEINFRTAWFRERLVYNNPTFSYSAESISNTVWLEATAARNLTLWNAKVEAGIQQGYFHAQSNDYTNPAKELRNSIFGGLVLPVEDGSVRMHVRREWNGGNAGPWVPSIQIDLRQASSLAFFARAGRTYRWPTLNDRFWTYGGNPSLRPENGWGGEAGANWRNKGHRLAVSAFLNTYLRYMNDWIQWIPGDDQIWRPQNIQAVQTEGIEMGWRAETQGKQVQFWIASQTDITRAQPTRSTWASDPALHKQLIYIPMLKNATQVGVNSAHWQVAYRHTWNTRTFTAPDHSEFLPALHLGQLDLVRKTASEWIPDISCSLRNLWNARYQSVAWQAMPGRHLLLQLQW